jgi:demethylmenaquinone methyltransferase/2-methoxy-6-polyprenyl-1,4-benzoquinol methylase
MSGSNPKTNLVAGSTQQEVIRMFDRISPVYDKMNRMMSLGMDLRWRRRAVAALDIPSGARVLDLACGTGDMTAIAISQQPGIRVVGVDPSPAMVAVGRPRFSRNGVVLVRSWGEYLPFSDSTFDRAMMAFGIRSFPDRIIALRELRRTVVAGGKLAILEMTSRKQSLLEAVFSLYFRGLMPLIGAVISRDWKAYHYLPDSVDAFPRPQDFLHEMMEAGWKSAKWTPMAGGVVSLFLAEK